MLKNKLHTGNGLWPWMGPSVPYSAALDFCCIFYIWESETVFSQKKINLIFIKNSIEQAGCSEVFKCVWYVFLSGYQSKIREFSIALKGNFFFPWDLYAVLFSLLGKMHTSRLKATEQVVNFKPEYPFFFLTLSYYNSNFYLFTTYSVPVNP